MSSIEIRCQREGSIEYVNPGGYAHHYPSATIADVQAEVKRLLQHQAYFWKHSPGLLILLDESELTKETLQILQPLQKRSYVKILSMADVEKIKGLEYQHVFIFIKKALYQELVGGFSGTGKKIYLKRRLLRIPFSRAKDSVVVFAVE